MFRAERSAAIPEESFVTRDIQGRMDYWDSFTADFFPENVSTIERPSKSSIHDFVATETWHHPSVDMALSTVETSPFRHLKPTKSPATMGES
jgi:hypothetical protein